MGLTPQVVLEERFEHPEGIVWDARRGRLLWLDVFEGEVHSLELASGARRTWQLGRPVGSVAPRADGGLICAVREGFALLSADGELTELDGRLAERSSLQMNDGGVDPRGRFWAGTISFEEGPGAASGELYRVDPDLSVHAMLDGVANSNGIGWSPDGGRLYYVDSATRRIDRFDFDPDAGEISNRQTLAEVEAFPDGLAVDAEGCVWVALYQGHEVVRFTPAGEVDRTLRLPGSQVTTCTFGGEDLRTLFVAVSPYGLEPGDPDAAGAGLLYAFEPGAQGLAVPEFGG